LILLLIISGIKLVYFHKPNLSEMILTTNNRFNNVCM